jgi:maleamate amidohydrolase
MDSELARSVAAHLAQMRERMSDHGFAGRVGFGRRPAVLVVDLQRGFTDPRSPLGADFGREIAATNELLSAARRAGAPVLFSVALAEAGLWARKLPANDLLEPGSEWVTLDPRLEPAADDQILPKHYPSCFFGTDLSTRLVSRAVDTLIIAGATTSGCVRATAVDACSSGLHTIVVGEAVGDRSALSHLVSLFDIDAKYADVVPLADAITYLADRGGHDQDREERS